MNINSKLPDVGTTIFAIMSKLANEHQAINLSQGFPNYESSPKLKNLVSHFVNKGYNQYAPMPGVQPLRAAIARKIQHCYDIKVDPDTEITITAGATQALFTAITAFVKKGDEVIIIEPAYDSYAPSIELCGGIVVPYGLEAPDFKINPEGFAKLITDKTRMIIINTPHNPTGSILEAEDMKMLEELTKGTDILVLSDEVYEHLIFDGQAHQTALLFPELKKRTLLTYSFGKTFHNTGWKMGYCVAPPMLTKEFRKVHQFNVFSVNHPIQLAIAEFLTDPEEYLQLPDFFQQKRDFFLAKMKDTRFKPVPCRGTYFQLFDYSEISNKKDTEFAKWLTIEKGVASIPISVFYSDRKDEKVIRFCFAKTEGMLAEAAEKLLLV